MGRIVSSFFISLDGVVESPDRWHFPYWNDEMGAVVEEGMRSSAGLLMGRTLYKEWSAYWTKPDSDQDLAKTLAGTPKHVVSSTLRTADWENTTVISGDVTAGVRALKERTDGDIQMSGSATTVRWLLAEGLLDELKLLVHPIAVGHGRRLFENTPTHPLKLVASETFQTGVLNLTYVPDAR